eukprot:446080-Rhodomonas_salina.2
MPHSEQHTWCLGPELVSRRQSRSTDKQYQSEKDHSPVPVVLTWRYDGTRRDVLQLSPDGHAGNVVRMRRKYAPIRAPKSNTNTRILRTNRAGKDLISLMLHQSQHASACPRFTYPGCSTDLMIDCSGTSCALFLVRILSL